MSTQHADTGEKLGNRGVSRGRPSQHEVAERIGASPATLRRWVRQGLVPQYDDHDGWTPAAGRNATVVARMRALGHSLSEILGALEEGRLAYAFDRIGEIKLKGFSHSTEMFVARLYNEEE